jgi:hypothetical protein
MIVKDNHKTLRRELRVFFGGPCLFDADLFAACYPTRAPDYDRCTSWGNTSMDVVTPYMGDGAAVTLTMARLGYEVRQNIKIEEATGNRGTGDDSSVCTTSTSRLMPSVGIGQIIL